MGGVSSASRPQLPPRGAELRGQHLRARDRQQRDSPDLQGLQANPRPRAGTDPAEMGPGQGSWPPAARGWKQDVLLVGSASWDRKALRRTEVSGLHGL